MILEVSKGEVKPNRQNKNNNHRAAFFIKEGSMKYENESNLNRK